MVPTGYDLIDYINEFTAITDTGWDGPEPAGPGLYPARPLRADRGRFCELVREFSRDHPRCDPFDRRQHDLPEIRDWIWPIEASPTGHELALKFIRLGTGLGLFKLESGTWDTARRQLPIPRERVALGYWVLERTQAGEHCGFRLRDDAPELRTDGRP
jgi:hypothetical protein